MFLNLPPALRDRDKSRYHVIPAPLEATVSYGKGTARGPQAILNASYQIELFDGKSIPARAGVFTQAAVPVSGKSPAAALGAIEKCTAETIRSGHIPVVLGGEHSITAAEIRALRKSVHNFGVVHFDAHADLRDTFTGTPYSHGSVMHRIAELGIPIFQIGVRSLCWEDHVARKEMKIRHLDAETIARKGIPRKVLPADFPRNIFISFDIDGLDCSLVPATGTPEPGGLSWFQTVFLLENVVSGRRVLGFDVVELAPVKGLHASDFVAAKLVYTIMGIIERGK